MDILKNNSVEEKIITIRGISVILDSDVAELYGVETMRINEAVKNNPEKFPEGYIFELSKKEKKEVIENFDNPKIKFSPAFPKAFTEKGLYMLATILKSPRATQATIYIVEAFAKLRELSQTLINITQTTEEEKHKFNFLLVAQRRYFINRRFQSTDNAKTVPPHQVAQRRHTGNHILMYRPLRDYS